MIISEMGSARLEYRGGWWRIWEPRTDDNGNNVGVQVSYDNVMILFEDSAEPKVDRVRVPAPKGWWLI